MRSAARGRPIPNEEAASAPPATAAPPRSWRRVGRGCRAAWVSVFRFDIEFLPSSEALVGHGGLRGELFIVNNPTVKLGCHAVKLGKVNLVESGLSPWQASLGAGSGPRRYAFR